MKKLILLIAPLIACALLTFPAFADTERDENELPAGSIVINPKDLWQVVVAVGAGICTLATAGGVITGVVHKAKSPNAKQNERLDALEANVKKIETRLDEGNKRFEADAEKMCALGKTVNETNKIIIESLQALTAHAIDGNNTDKLKASEEALNEYLRSKI